MTTTKYYHKNVSIVVVDIVVLLNNMFDTGEFCSVDSHYIQQSSEIITIFAHNDIVFILYMTTQYMY